MTTPSPNVGYVLAASGDTAAAMAWLRALQIERPRSAIVESGRAFILLALGDTAQGLTALEGATDAGEIWYMQQPVSNPVFDSVRGSPRFAMLLRRVGLSASASVDPARSPR